MNKIKVQIKRNKYVIMFPKQWYSEARSLALLTDGHREEFLDNVDNIKNRSGTGWESTIHIYNVYIFFNHRNAGLLKYLEYYWLYYLEM